MSIMNAANLATQPYTHNHLPETVNTGNAEVNKGNVNTAKSLDHAAVKTDGILTSVLNQTVNSLTIIDGKAQLKIPESYSNKTLPASSKSEILQAIENNKSGKDIDNIDQAVAFVAATFGSQLLSTLAHLKTNDSAKAASKEAVNSAHPSSSSQTRSQPALEGGVDITAADSTSHVYSNVMGNMRTMQAFMTIMSVLNKHENEANKLAAKWSENTMNSAILAGNKGIDAAQQRMNGAITGGILSLGMQGASTGASLKALNNESRSIKNNLSNATKTEFKLTQSENAIKNSRDKMVQNGQEMSPEVLGRMSQHHPQMNFESATLRNAHQKISNDTSKTRVTAELMTQGGHATNSIVQGTYEVSAAEESKQADIARGNQTVTNEVDNTFQQVAKKANDSENGLRQALMSILNNNNDAVSAIANRMG